MTTVLQVALVVGLCALASASCSPPLSAANGTWVVTFEDNFDGDALNTTSWTASNYSSVVSEYDGHDALFIADRVTVADGNLVLTTVWDPQEFNGVQYNMTSGWVDSQQKRNQTNGRFEASIKMPVSNATGSWPAWWLLPEGECWPVSGEIDIVEWYAGEGHNQHSRTENPAQMSSSFHYGYGCGDDLYTYPNDTVWWPSGNWTPNWPVRASTPVKRTSLVVLAVSESPVAPPVPALTDTPPSPHLFPDHRLFSRLPRLRS